MFFQARRNNMAFLPVVAAAPLASIPRAAVCARPQTSAFLGAPVAVARTARPGAATIRMDVTVVVGDNEPIESALRRFKKDVTKSGHLFELRRRRYFETTTEKNIRKRAQSLRKARIARNMANKQRNIGS